MRWTLEISPTPVAQGLATTTKDTSARPSLAPTEVSIYGGTHINIGRDHVQIDCDLRKLVIDWPSNMDYNATKSEILKKRVDNTGNWLLSSPEFLSWLADPDRQIMWCHGIPGVGKTVLSALVTNHLQENGGKQTFVGCIYFNYQQQNDQNLTSVIRALSRQLYESDTVALSTFEALYEAHKQSTPKFNQLQRLLSDALARYDNVHIVIDALDEYTEHYTPEKLMELVEVILSLGNHVKLFVTSRLLAGMADLFESLGATRLEICVMESDLEQYIQERMLDPGFDFPLTPALRDQIVREVIKSSKGRFLVAVLHMDSLFEHSSPGDLKDALKALPDSIDKTYAQCRGRIDRQSGRRKELAIKTIMWITRAARPLSVIELQYALALQPGRENVADYLSPISTITAACAGLVVIQKGHWQSCEDYMGFVHYTAQEYFDHHLDKMFSGADRYIAMTCLDYLSGLDYTGRQSLGPFTQYALFFWGCHANPLDQNMLGAIATFYKATQWRRRSHIRHFYLYRLLSTQSASRFLFLDRAGKGAFTENGMPISLAIYHHDHETLSTLLDVAKNEPVQIYGKTPIQFAINLKRRETFDMLIKRRPADLDVKDCEGCTPLITAIHADDPYMAETLLSQPGIAYGGKDWKGRTALSWAAYYGSVPMVWMLLLHRDTDVNSQDDYGCCSLSLTLMNDNPTVTGILLAQSNININLPDKEGRTPLDFARYYERSEAIIALLTLGGAKSFGAEWPRKDEDYIRWELERYRPPAHSAARRDL